MHASITPVTLNMYVFVKVLVVILLVSYCVAYFLVSFTFTLLSISPVSFLFLSLHTQKLSHQHKHPLAKCLVIYTSILLTNCWKDNVGTKFAFNILVRIIYTKCNKSKNAFN